MTRNNMERRQDASVAAASPPAAANTTLYLAIGVGVGVAILFAMTGVAIRIVLKKKQHQREVAELEHGASSTAISPGRNTEQAPRPVTMRCSQVMPNSQQGWDALRSSETLNVPSPVARHPQKRLRSSVLPKRLRNRRIQFGKNKYLSAIVELESPIRDKASPELPSLENMEKFMASSNLIYPEQDDAGQFRSHQATTATGSARSASPTLDALPSFAKRSPTRYDANRTKSDDATIRVARSASAGLLGVSVVAGTVSGQAYCDSYRLYRPDPHTRSLSLGAPTSQPPSGPVPPIPARSPHRLITKFGNDEDARQVVCISRTSSSSGDSASSSVLVTSPILTRNSDNDALQSPTLEDVVAEDEHASLKTGASHQWLNPRIDGPRPNTTSSASKLQKSVSVCGSIIRFSSESLLTRKLSTASSSSEGSFAKQQRLSIAQIGTANSIMMSRVSSSNSLTGSLGGVQKVSTPPRKIRNRRQSVSASGSPAERRRAGILRDISGKASKFTVNRESSDSTPNSGRSSCGNPFQWDTSATKLNVPSALKGSPNARKGHRRQNCVRISTLTPQVLGPVRSRSASPAGLMDRIKEESECDEFHRAESGEVDGNEKQLIVQKRRPSPMRQFSSSTLPDNLRVKTLRASITSDSPTLSVWNAYQEAAGLTSAASDSNLPISPDGSRPGSKQSNRSSGTFDIPKFPTPSKSQASVAAVNRATPLPEFSMDFDNEKDGSSPFALASSPSSSEASPVSPLSPDARVSRVSQVSPVAFQLPSSPPDQLSAKKEYDPAWPAIHMPIFGGEGDEYDPASPPEMSWDAMDPERSSCFLPFAAGNIFGDDREDRTQTNRVAKEESPPCSPKSSPMPDTQARDVETLTSSNASRMMSRLPSTSSSGVLGLNSIPILLPPTTSEDPAYQLPEWKPPAVPTQSSAPRPRRVTSTGSPNRIRRRSPEPFLPTIPQSSSPPQAPKFHTVRPFNTAPPAKSNTLQAPGNTSPKGPRNAPAKSVLNNISKLRRMNSECNTGTPNRQSRNWQLLGRQASPSLPFTGAILPTEDSSNSLFDFDFGTRTSEQYTQGGAADGEVENGMGNLLDKNTFDRVLDGALAGFHAEFTSWSAEKDKNGEQRPTSSVWDDGERFWQKQPDSAETPSCKVHAAEATPRRSAEPTFDPKMLSTTPRQMATQMNSPGNTPKSLYDADGFLKT